jgi:glycerol-3-phosphate dehydrogenase (NAD(P)+)
MSRLSIIGAGAWGTALAIQAARSGTQVTLWARDPERARMLRETRDNPRLPGRILPGPVDITAELPQTDEPKLLAVPMQHLREIAARLPPGPLICCAKGIETATLRLPLEILAELHPGAPAAVLTGPNFAGEIAAGLPAAAVIAASDAALREHVTALLATPTFRLYGNDDPIGAQVGGAAKNVIAIAAGAVMGVGIGENARAGLITRGLAELARFATGLGGRAETVMGLSGLGDLVLSCTSATSRNYGLGLALGRGEALEAVLASSSAVIEGVATAPALVARAGGLDMPICRAVAALLSGAITLDGAIRELLARPRRDE